MAKEVIEQKMTMDGKQVVSTLDNIKQHAESVNTTLSELLNHLNSIEKGLKNVKSITNNVDKIGHQKNVYEIGNAKNVVTGPNGAISSETGRGKLFKEYEQSLIDLTNAQKQLLEETKKDVEERKNTRKQRADAESQRAANEAARIAKKEDQSTAAYQARMDKLADAKLLNAQNRVGAKDRSWRYQGARMLSSVGGAVGQ